MKDRDSLVRSTTIISIATSLSRVLGLVRDTLIYAALPIAVLDPFVAAFRIPNTLRRLFAEGALSAAFIPAFTECLELEGPDRAARLGSSLFKILFIWLLVISLLGILFAPHIVRFLPSEDTLNGEREALTVELLRVMFPYILLIGLAAATMGMLNSLGKFFAPAFSPAMLNIAMITTIGLGQWWLSEQGLVRLLAVGVMLGGVLQLLIQWVPLQKRLPLNLLEHPLWDAKLAPVLWLMLPLAFGQAIMEINILVDTYFAWTIVGGNAYLFAANRIIQFPLGIFGIAIATVTFPRLSREAVQQENSLQTMADTVVFSVRKILFIMLPSAVGIALIGYDLVAAIFEHGFARRQDSVGQIYLCALYYALGLPAFAAVKIVVSAFYAQRNAHIPALVGVLAVIANIVLDMTLIVPLGAGGLALATTLSSYINLVVLTMYLSDRLHAPIFRRLAGPLLRGGLSAALMGLGIALLGLALPEGQGRFSIYLLRLLVLVPLGTLLYLGCSHYLQPEESRQIIGAFRGRLRRKP